MKTKIVEKISIIIILLLIAFNYDVIYNNLQKENIGIFIAFALFFYHAKAVKFRVDYLLFFAILCIQLISYQLHINSLHFLSLELLIILLYYILTQKISFIGIFSVLIFSSFFDVVFNGISTEIKQEICKWVFYSLKNFTNISRLEGVNFYIDHVKITIDSSCMGLNLFKTGILFIAILIALEEKKQQKTFDFLQLIIVFLAVIVLNIFSNYFRIITLVLFECIEDNFLHQLVGWVSFLIYQIIPTLFIIKYGIKPKLKSENFVSKTNKSMFFILSIIVMLTSIRIKEEKNYYLLQNLPQKYKNGSWVVKNHVYKKLNQDTLVYVKAPFHKPTICWTGSGYKILNQKIIQKNKDKIWKITMEKNQKKYHSYYWYQVGNCKETSYIKATFLGLIDKKPIQLINETVAVK